VSLVSLQQMKWLLLLCVIGLFVTDEMVAASMCRWSLSNRWNGCCFNVSLVS
jgi:hypothetical protein